MLTCKLQAVSLWRDASVQVSESTINKVPCPSKKREPKPKAASSLRPRHARGFKSTRVPACARLRIPAKDRSMIHTPSGICKAAIINLCKLRKHRPHYPATLQDQHFVLVVCYTGFPHLCASDAVGVVPTALWVLLLRTREIACGLLT